MKLKVKEVGEFYVPEGAVVARVDRYELIQTDNGERLRIWFDDGKGKFALWFSPKLTLGRSNLWKLVTAMGFEIKPDQEFDLDQILGKEVGIIVLKNERGFGKFGGAFAPDQAPF